MCVVCMICFLSEIRRINDRKYAPIFRITPIPALKFEKIKVKVAMKLVLLDSMKTGHLAPPNIDQEASVRQAAHALATKPTTINLYIDLNCDRITQHINMPLLRLVYRLFSVIQIISKSCYDLKEVTMDIEPMLIRTFCSSYASSSSSDSDTAGRYLARSVSQSMFYKAASRISKSEPTPQVKEDTALADTEAKQPLCWENLRIVLESYSISIAADMARDKQIPSLFVIKEEDAGSKISGDDLETLERQPVMGIPTQKTSSTSGLYSEYRLLFA